MEMKYKTIVKKYEGKTPYLLPHNGIGIRNARVPLGMLGSQSELMSWFKFHGKLSPDRLQGSSVTLYTTQREDIISY